MWLNDSDHGTRPLSQTPAPNEGMQRTALRAAADAKG